MACSAAAGRDLWGRIELPGHAMETGAQLPDSPVIFAKPPTRHRPRTPDSPAGGLRTWPEVDYEAELAVVIGKTARDVTVDTALEHVLGYTCANDVSARRWQKHGGGGQWVRGKSFDTFCPLGPVLVTADEIPNPQALSISSKLNGRTMQSSSTADMIFPVAELIAFISRDTTAAGHGDPDRNARRCRIRPPPLYLMTGDTIEITIDGIGTLSNPVMDA